MAQKYRCGRCGVVVGCCGSSSGGYWKHFNSGYGRRSCDKPLPLTEEEYARREEELVKAAQQVLARVF